MTAETDALLSRFEESFGRRAEILSVAPGRVNLIGEHTDYNGGLVLPVAIDRTVAVLATTRDDGRVHAYSVEFEARDDWPVAAPRRTGRTEWRDYVRGVAWALLDAGHDLTGADIAVCGDVPIGSGLSSSAALEVAVAGALCSLSAIELAPRELALLCQKAENQFVGVQSGIMDQFAAALSQEGTALLIDCRSLAVEHIPLGLDEQGVAVVIIDSKVRRGLAETAYNRRREECAEAAKALRVESLRDASEGSIEMLREPLRRRARHVITENARVTSAVTALRDGDMGRLGELMYDSHQSLRDDFEVSTPELDLLVQLASETEGVLGARLTGAGFGGCTVNLVRQAVVEQFRDRVLSSYESKTGLAAQMHVVRPAGGLKVSRV